MKRELMRYPRVFTDSKSAKVYAEKSEKRNRQTAEKFIKKLSEHGFNKGKILDAGCGCGTIAVELALAFPEANVIGIDLSEPLLKMSEEACENAGISSRVSFIKCDVEKMDFDDNTFDAVICLNLLYVVKYPLKMLDEIERVLKPNGLFILEDMKRSSFGYFMPVLRSALTLDEGKYLIQKSNFREVEYDSGLMWWGASAKRSKKDKLNLD